jgi:transaldolase
VSKIDELLGLGQAVWIDYIERSMITSGKLQGLIDQGIRGVTSNPTIFEKAIDGSNDYDDDLRKLARQGKSAIEMYEEVVMWDISHTADLFRPIYDRLNGADGLVSLEVSPGLAYDTRETIHEAKRLFKTLNRPNVMIKVPATEQGVPAIETLTGEGMNVNVTLLFSVDRYEQVAEAFIKGLEKFHASGGDVSKVSSVASFFVSRVDTATDPALDRAGNSDLQGKIAIANAKTASARSKTIFSSDRWKILAGQGARVQRLLWASTSTKNPNYPDTLYIDGLIGENTVNTMPLATLQAFLDHGKVAPALDSDLDEAMAGIDRLAGLGINLSDITAKLEGEGVSSFSQSFEKLLKCIQNKSKKVA